jgi:SOS response regulatory protein OraA/RecX
MDTERLEHASAQSLHLLDKRMAFFAEVWRQLASPELQKGQKK